MTSKCFFFQNYFSDASNEIRLNDYSKPVCKDHSSEMTYQTPILSDMKINTHLNKDHFSKETTFCIQGRLYS